MERICVLTGGHIGPARGKLVAGREIDLFPTDEPAEALAAIASVRPRLCIFRYQLAFGTVVDLLQELHGSPKPTPPILVVLAEEEWQHADACIEAGATDVLELGDVEQIVHTAIKLLGLQFGRGPRAQVDAKIELLVDAQWLELRTTDLRPTGLAVTDVPASVDVGHRLRVRVDILDYGLEVWAMVARIWDRDGHRMAGIQLIGLSKQQRIYVEAAVATLRVGERQSVAPEALVEGAGDAVDEAGGTIRWHLEQLLLGKGQRNDHPVWLFGVVPELTPIERSSVLGVGVPQWVHRAVNIRIALAQYRDECPVGPPPQAITDACQALFNAIANEVEDAEDFDVGEQISLIKGRFIREFLDGPEAHAAGDDIGFGAMPLFEAPPPPGTFHRQQSAPALSVAKPTRLDLPPPPLAVAARSMFAPAWLCAVLALLFAVAIRVMSANEPDIALTVLPAKDLSTPSLSSMSVATDFASAKVTTAWHALGQQERIQMLVDLKKKLIAWELPVRFIAVHDEDGVPVALFSYDRRTLLQLDQPMHLILTERR